MRHVDTPKLRIAYEEAGDGPNVLVLVHGNFASARWWRPVLDRLPTGFRAVAPVLRGCAGTRGVDPSAKADFTIPRLADDLDDFADALDLPAFHLVGHSLGGAVAMQYALDHPERVRSLALVASSPAAGLAALREGDSRAARMIRMLDPGSAPSMRFFEGSLRMQRLFGYDRVMLGRALRELVPELPPDGPSFDALVEDAARMTPDAVAGFYEALHRWSVERELRRIVAPTLVLAGGRDALVPRAALERTARLLPHAELVDWPESGHAPMLERPDELVRLCIAHATRASFAMRFWTWLWLAWAWVVARARARKGRATPALPPAP